MHALMFAPLVFGGGVSEVFAPVAHADSGKRPGKGKNGKDNDGVGPFKKKDYPLAERARPLTLPASMGEVTPSLTFTHFGAPGDLDFDTFSLGAGFKYGLANVVEVGITSGLLLSPDFDWNRNFTLEGHYLAYDTKRFDVAPGLVIPLNFVDDTAIGVQIDATSRYLVQGSPFFFRFGQGVVNVAVSPDFGLAVSANGGVGYQINKTFVATLDTSLLTIQLTGDSGVTGLWDYFTFRLGGQYTVNRNADVGVTLNYGNILDVDEDYVLGLTGYGRIRF